MSLASLRPKARYFPVKPGPLRMQPGLSRFGVDFGNGSVDALFFQRDPETPRYLAAKAAVLARHPERFAWLDGDAEQRALEHVTRWIEARAQLEHAGDAPPEGPWQTRFEALARATAEDIVVIARDAGGQERAILVHVCFPSGWRPEAILGQSFLQIHAPVPELEAIQRSASALVDALIERGPYVRFVWTVSADDRLDHHPDHGRTDAWSRDTTRGFLRVERQVTVPLPEVGASLFLIRTYLYAFDELTAAERALLGDVLRETSPAVLAYKGLHESLPHVLRALTT